MEIKFDPTTRKTEGPFESREALESACATIDPAKMDTADYQAWHDWAVKYDVDPASGSIITTAYNPDLLDRRAQVLELQLDNVLTGKPASSGFNYTKPPALWAAFEAAAQEGAPDPIEVLSISSTRETLYFDLQKEFPQLNLRTTIAAVSEDFADRCNNLIQTKAPEFLGKLIFENDWQKQNQHYDVAIVNPAALYYDKEGLENLAQTIKDTGAKRIVFHDLKQNTDPNGAAQWYAQRYSGGVIPFLVPARGELTRVMKDSGYDLVSETAAPVTIDLNKASNFEAENPKLDTFSYILRAAPA